MKIGAKLKELRVQKSLTQEELADRTELSKGFISQLERDLTSPSIATLMDILQVLGTDLKDFFNEEPEEQIVFHQGDFFIDEGEDHTIEWIIPNAQKNAMEPILLTINPLKKSRTIKSHEGEEFGYVLKGKIELVMGKKRYKVKAKETFYISGRNSHYLYNPSNTPAKVLWVSTPPRF